MNNNAGQAVRSQLCRISGDCDISESLKSKMRLEDLGTAALERIADRLFSCAQILGVEVPLTIKNFGVPECDGRSGRTLNLQPDPSHHVLTHVGHYVARRSLRNLYRPDLLDASNGRPRGRDQVILRMSGDSNSGPLRIVKIALSPVWFF